MSLSVVASESDYVPYQATSALPSGSVLVLAPHPDDEVIGCAGAILQHLRQGDQVTVVIATDGAAAVAHEDAAARESYCRLRIAESQAAARVLGYECVRTLGVRDRQLSAWPQLEKAVRSLVAEITPATLYAPSVYEVHPDHEALARAVCRVTEDLTYDINLMFYEVGYPAPVNLLLDITDDVQRKREALRCFESQLKLQDYLRHAEALNVYRTYTLPPQVHAAEGYLTLSSANLAESPMRCYGRTRLTDQVGRKGYNRQ